MTTIYWYQDRRRNQKYGTINQHKRDAMADQNYAIARGECDIADFDGKLLGSEFIEHRRRNENK